MSYKFSISETGNETQRSADSQIMYSLKTGCRTQIGKKIPYHLYRR